MKKTGFIFLTVGLMAVYSGLAVEKAAPAAIAVESLQVEHAINPLGIDSMQPRLSWILKSEIRGQVQSAYQILVASSRQKLDSGEADLWDSGKINTDQSVYVPYGGKTLQSHQECWWKVKVWDRDGKVSFWSKPGKWTMGILTPEEWRGQWIGYNPVFPRQLPETGVLSRMNWDGASWIWTGEGDATTNAPAGRRYFKWTFDVPKMPAVRKAYLRAAGDDSFKLYLNTVSMHATLGDDWRKPGEVDVSYTLRTGKNTIGVELLNAKAGTAGWTCKLAVEFDDGTIIEKTPDAASVVWTDKRTEAQKPKWLTSKTDVEFKPAMVVGPVGIEPWGKPEYGFMPGWNQTAPSPLLRKTFTINKPLKRAVVYSSGLGCHELYCNGQRVGDEVLDPAFTQYDVTALYVAHDITGLLKQGSNALGAMLGNGWYNMATLTVWNDYKAKWRDRPKLILQLQLEYEDGSVQEIVSDTSWKASTGPVLADSVHNGEQYDAREEKPGWAASDFDASQWAHAEVMSAPQGTLRPQTIAPMRITQTIKPVAITEPKPGVYVFDLGQNIAGHARLRIQGTRGSQISLIYGEKLQDSGYVDRHLAGLHFSGSWQEDTYILNGAASGEEWEARFAYHGFRYVEVRGLPSKPTLDTLDGRVVHTDFPVTGGFECSDPMINAIQRSTVWTYRDNFHGFPEDCPTREKKGWTGDGHLSCEQAMWNFDNSAGYFKWLSDMRDVQKDDGRLRTVVPSVAGGEAFDWNVAVIIVPWTVYQYTGDAKILEDNYAAMQKWMGFYISTRPDHIVLSGVGDWVNPDGPNSLTNGPAPFEVTSTCYYHTAAKLMSSIAKLLNKPDDAERYSQLAEKIQTAFNAKFVSEDGTVSTGGQSVQACALFHDMIPAGKQDAVYGKLLEKINAADDHHATGLLGTKAIYRILSDHGQTELAYKMVTQKTPPSYGYWIEEGFTTLNEMWGGGKVPSLRKAGRGGSNNHPWSGDISAWFYQYLAGINVDPRQPGFKHIIIRPMPVAALKTASAWHQTPYGKVSSSWRIEGSKLILDVTVPVNTTATIYVPGRNVKVDNGVSLSQDEKGVTVGKVGSGSYSFTSEL